MRSHHGWRELDRLVGLAFGEAVGLRHGFAGTGHFLLALVRPEESTVAAQALRECGIEYDAFRSAFADSIAETDPPVPTPVYQAGISLNPAAHELLGCASGLALGLGAEEPVAEHVLLAFLWRPGHEWMLGRVGTTRQAVYERLRERGLPVPRAALPPAPPPPSGEIQRVYFPQERLRDVLRRLPTLLPEDTSWGWNVADDFRAWVAAEGDFDLDEIVQQALAPAS